MRPVPVVPVPVVPVPLLTVTDGWTTTWPADRPELIWVVVSPTRPVVMVCVVFLPFFKRVTVEVRPVVVMAEVGSSSRLDAEATTTDTLVVIPDFTVRGDRRLGS